MTVYFIQRLGDNSQIKIGSTNNIAVRMRNHTAALGDIKLFAQCAGGLETERLYQKAFSHLRVEGEWFTATDELRDFIAQNADAVDTTFLRSEQGWTKKTVDTRGEEDGRVAYALVRQCIEKHPATTTISAALEAVFNDLHNSHSCWTRRRIRSIYEGTTRRVDVFEIVDLMELVGIPRSEWADVIAPQIPQQAAAIS